MPAAARLIAESRLIVVLRHIPTEALPGVARALLEGGVRVVEVALNTADALKQLRLLKERYFCAGAGTVLDEKMGQTALEAGADFLFSPIRSEFFLPLCRQRNVLGIPGGLSPTEIYRLHAEGAEFIKVFPTSVADPHYLREILAPFESLKLIPAGGVDLERLEAYLQAGAAAVAVGSEIADPQLAREGNYGEIAKRALRFTETLASIGQS